MVENSRVTINPNVWDSILGFTAIFALVGMTTTWVWRKVKPEPNEELESLESQIRRTAARLHDADENAAHAREHFTKLMRDYGLTVMPTEVQMSKYRVLRVAKDRWDTLEKKVESLRGYLFKLTRRRKELKGEV